MGRALDLEGKSVTPEAEAIYADADSSDSYQEASRKLKNLADVTVSKATLQHHGIRTGEEMQAFKREDVEAERVLLGIDGTGVPMATPARSRT